MRRDSLLLNKLLSVLLSVALVMQGVPSVPAYADEPQQEASVTEKTDVPAGEPEAVRNLVEEQEPATIDGTGEVATEAPEQEAPAAESVVGGSQPIAAQIRTLNTRFIAVDGVLYNVEASFVEDASIPSNATLRVRELRTELTSEERNGPVNKNRPYEYERFLKAGELDLRQTLLKTAAGIVEDDYWVGHVLLDVALESDGIAIDAAVPIQLVITTDAIEPERASTAQAVLLSNEGLRTVQKAQDRNFSAKQLAQALEGGIDYWLLETRGVASGSKEQVEVTIETERLGELGLVWDNGYRSAALRMADVTVEGLMPEGTQGTARDVTKNYDEPALLIGGNDEKAAAKVDKGTLELTALAAYDITLRADGEEYQPDEGHPLTVTIVNSALVEGQDVRLWHIADDGTIEAIEDFELRDGAISFEALGFSTYVVVQESVLAEETASALADETKSASDEGTSSIPLSSTFTLRASAKTYARSSTVTFVDENKDPIMGTVTGTINVKYTGGGAESNETNTIDMYSFADKLDPAILDEYDFSRVFVQLTETEEKDFRYMQVGDGSAIGQSSSIYRAYLNLEGIEQNEDGKDYFGTWYQLNFGGAIDNIYIEFYHVGPASFYALDTRNDPVEGAEFALFTDPDCYVPLEYKNEEVKAVSNKQGLVSFGKIPRGTYYMKETVIPEGYKKSTDIYTVVVDGESTIANVIHDDDDGSVIISDVLRMTLTKEWDDGRDHATDSVDVEVLARGEVVAQVTLSAANNWTTTIDDLDPNEPYMVSETCVRSGETDVTNNWIPTITYEELDPHAEYYKADEFKKGKQYVLVTTTASGTRALVGDSNLTTTPIEVNGEKAQISGTVTDDMLWSVDTITKDGVIALKNVASGKYLNQDGKWMLDSEYPEPLYVRHINDDGIIRFYHRANLNSAAAYYLYIWYSKGNKAEGTVDRYRDDASKAATFDIYRKVNVRSVDVTIANKGTRYPIEIRNLVYPNGTPLAGMTYDLYTQQAYNSATPGAPYFSGLTAGEDGYLRDGENVKLELDAGTYYLCQTSDLQSEGYAPLDPIKFVITRGGALRVAQEDQPIVGFPYSSSITEGDTTLPVLQIPNCKTGTFELSLAVEGSYADPEREFVFALEIPEGIAELNAKVNGKNVVLTAEQNTFKLAHGQTALFEDVPNTVDYVLTQTSRYVAKNETEAEAKYVPTCLVETQHEISATVSADDWRTVTLAAIKGTNDNPARVKITNTLGDSAVMPTGLDDNALVWLGIVAGAVLGIALLFTLRRRRKV